MAHAGGRPTKYNAELQAKADKYLEIYESLGDKIPSHEGIFIEIGISSACGYNWALDEEKPKFLDTLDRCTALQKRKLINSGLDSTFNSNITKLVLHQHGMSDKQDTKVSGAIGVVDLSGKTDDELKDIIGGS